MKLSSHFLVHISEHLTALFSLCWTTDPELEGVKLPRREEFAHTSQGQAALVKTTTLSTLTLGHSELQYVDLKKTNKVDCAINIDNQTVSLIIVIRDGWRYQNG